MTLTTPLKKFAYQKRARLLASLCSVTLALHGTTLAAQTFHNFQGYQHVDGQWHAFNWLTVENGKITDTGAGELKAADKDAVDMKGAHVLPGLIDAHGHVLGFGQEQQQVDLRGSQSVDEVIARVKAFQQKHPKQEWLVGRGWNQVLWADKNFPNAAQLDAHFPNSLIVLERVDGHATWVNSNVMKKANISKKTTAPQGGQIIRDASGKATGIFVDNAANLITAQMPAVTVNTRAQTLKDGMNALIKLGMTGVHDAGISLEDYQAYRLLGEQKQLPMRVYAMLADSAQARKRMEQAPEAPAFAERLYLQSIKAWADGALGSRGAAMLSDYSDHPHHKGLMLYTPKELQSITKTAIASGWQVNIHAIGDAGNRLVLDIFEQTSRDGKAQALRHRIEHAQIIEPSDIPRFHALNVIASIQPTHATSDMNMAEDRVGAERIKGAYAWRRLLDANVRLAGGSDFPVELANPFHGLYAAITRKDRDGKPLDGWYPDQKLTRAEALSLFTIDAAYAGHMEHSVGALRKGQWADFIVVNKSYFEIDESEIDDVEVSATYVAGEKVF